MTIFLEEISRPLFILHGLTAGLMVGLLTHHALWVNRKPLQVPRFRHQARIFIRWGAAITALQLALGLLIYPTYRVRVRAAYFDQVIDGLKPNRWLSSLFDLKEHSASLLLALTVSLCLADLLQDEVRAGRFPALGRHLHRSLAVAAAALAWLTTIIGLWISSYHGLPHGSP